MPATPNGPRDEDKLSRKTRRSAKARAGRIVRKRERLAAKKLEALQRQAAILDARRAALTDEDIAAMTERRLFWVGAAVVPTSPIATELTRKIVVEQAADANEQAKVERNVANDPCEWLFSRGSLSQRQHEAAEKIRAVAEAAEIGSNRAAPIGERVQGGGKVGGLTDRQATAIRQKEQCLARLEPIGRVLVIEVAVYCNPLKAVGERLGLGPHYRAPRLAEALDVVADFFKIYAPPESLRVEVFGNAESTP